MLNWRHRGPRQRSRSLPSRSSARNWKENAAEEGLKNKRKQLMLGEKVGRGDNYRRVATVSEMLGRKKRGWGVDREKERKDEGYLTA